MTPNSAPSRSELLRRQGMIECGFAVATALVLAGGVASTGVAVAVGALAIWMAWRGRLMVDNAVPLDGAERRELDRLKGQSQHVRELVAMVERAGQQPVRFDLQRCRRLARVESMLDGRA